MVVLDNAKIHTCQKFKGKLPEWEEHGLYIYHLPKYNPHLNLIETLWRKIKYEWLEVADYIDWGALTEALTAIFKRFGTAYSMDFKELEVSHNFN
jgi:transposase